MNIESCSLAHFTFDNGMSNILKRRVIKNVFIYSGCMFFIEAAKKFQVLCSDVYIQANLDFGLSLSRLFLQYVVMSNKKH